MKCNSDWCVEHGGCKDDFGAPCIHYIHGIGAVGVFCYKCTPEECNYESDDNYINYQI